MDFDPIIDQAINMLQRHACSMFAVVVALLILAGCASFQPVSINDIRFRDRAEARHDDDVRVSVAVPTIEESRALFGANLAKKGIQPIWVKVENHGDRPYYLMPSGIDANYFSPMEAAFAVKRPFHVTARKQKEHYYRAMSFRSPVLPNAAASGFIFTNLDEGEKLLHVTLIANQQAKFFTFFVHVPGMRIDYHSVHVDQLYAGEDIVEFNADALRATLERLPCCTTDNTGTRSGDPLNLVIIGSFEEMMATFARQGWLPAEETYATAVWKTIKSFLMGSQYRYAPISPLYHEGRRHDLARQKPRRNIHERNHLRLWRSPMRFDGKPVFVGQISRDIGIRLTSKAWPPMTHKIDPDVDEARQALMEDFIFSQSLTQVGFVKGVGRATPSKPRQNLTGDPYFTDGLRAVMVIEQGPVSLEEIQALDWETPKNSLLQHFEAETQDGRK